MLGSCRIAVAMGLFTSMLVALDKQAAAQIAGPTTHAGSDDPLLTLNKSSQALYAQAKIAALDHHGPVIIVSGDDLVLRNGEKRVQVRVTPEIYHTLKAIAHVPMAIDVALTAHWQEATLSTDFLQELRDYRGLLSQAGARIATAGLSGEDRERQTAILAASSAFLDSVIARKACTTAERTAFARKMNPLVMANGSAAARAQIDALHQQVTAWKGQMKPEQWHRLTVLVIGRQLPRKGNLAVQYFAHLLGARGEGKRIIYAEGLAEEPRALDLLATHLVDTQIAVDFFNDPERMNRDLLSDAARDYLPLLPSETQPPPGANPGSSR